MKRTVSTIMMAGALLFLAMPLMAQKVVKLSDIQKSQQKAQAAQVQTINDGVATQPGAQQPATAQQPANIPLTCTWNETDHDFGTSILHQKPASATFTITNKGNGPVTINEVTTSCGCTASKYTKEPIKPGENGTVTLTYDSKITGFFTKSAIVKLNDGQKYVLTIKGTVQKAEN